jgi:hypothetical protein
MEWKDFGRKWPLPNQGTIQHLHEGAEENEEKPRSG